MFTLTGEFNGAELGYTLASLDFNGDGYKDLAVLERGWNPLGHVANQDTLYWGKILFYYGGPNFDTLPDFVIQGAYHYNMYMFNMINCGDMNGDGCEDLGVVQYAEPDSTHPWDRDTKLKIYVGGQNPITQPGFIETYLYTQYAPGKFWISSIGDINNDGYDDISIRMGMINPTKAKFEILFGGTSLTHYVFYTSSVEVNNWISLKGIGDVNNDNYNDIILSTTVNNDNLVSRIVLYFGCSDISEADSLVLGDSSIIQGRLVLPVGDVNNDNYSDFIGCFNEINGIWSGKFWFGGNTISSLWNTEISPNYFGEYQSCVGAVYGDLNNDGYDDIIGTQSGIDWGIGAACIWMGSANFNGTVDLEIGPPSSTPWWRFGESIAAGDFNADGLCDVAISAPQWWNGSMPVPGKVFIYSGNAELADTTVGVEDDNIPVPDVSKWDITLSPNPVTNKSSQINIQFIGSGYKNATNLKVSIYDIKGRKVLSKSIPDSNLREGNWSVALKGIKPGLCILNISDGSNKLISRNFIIN